MRRVAVPILVVLTFAGLVILVIWRASEMRRWQQTSECLRACAGMVFDAQVQLKKLPPYEGPFGQKKTGTFHYHLTAFWEANQVYEQTQRNAPVWPFLSPHDPSRTNDGAGAANFVVNLRLFYTNGGTGELGTGDNRVYLNWDQVKAADGLSNTLLFATKYQVCGDGGSHWYDSGMNAPDSRTAATFGVSMQPWQRAPKQTDCNPTAGTAVSFHANSISVAMCDSSVHRLSADISPATWQALHTWAGNDTVGRDFGGP